MTLCTTYCAEYVLWFILSNKIDDGNEHMELILYLLRIMEIVYAPKLLKSSLAYLDELIKDFISYFHRLHPEVNLINKFHHITHYADCIEWSGPLANFCCLRFEGKHIEMKNRGKNVYNFKNPPKTLIRVCQSVQCTKWGSGDVKINSFKIQNGKSRKVYSLMSRQHLLNFNYSDNDILFCPETLIVNGIEFRKGLFVILETDRTRSNNLPLYSRIEEIVVLPNNQFFLMTSIYRTLFFDITVNAYCIEFDNHDSESRFVDVSTLPFYKPFSHWMKLSTGATYISHRHIII